MPASLWKLDSTALTAIRPKVAGWYERLYGSSSGYVGRKCPAVGPSVDFTEPSADANGIMQSDGSAVLSLSRTLSNNGIAGTPTDGLVLSNATAAVNGTQQRSPRLRFTGQGWKTDATAASQQVDFTAECRPVQGAANPSGTLVISAQINGGGYTDLWSLTSAGLLTLSQSSNSSLLLLTLNNSTNGTAAIAGLSVTQDLGAAKTLQSLSSGFTNSGSGLATSGRLRTSSLMSGGLVLATGTTAPIYFATNDAFRWNVSSAGHFLAVTDNSVDIGASGATRPRNLYVAGTIQPGGSIIGASHIFAGQTSAFSWTGRSILRSSADGLVTLLNQAETDFTRLLLGGTTNSFPALGRSTVYLHVLLADGSAGGGISFSEGANLKAGTTTGSKLGVTGGSSGEKWGFFGATPIVQPLFATGAAHTVDELITVLQNLGLVRQS